LAIIKRKNPRKSVNSEAVRVIRVSMLLNKNLGLAPKSAVNNYKKKMIFVKNIEVL
jgi:hypothetical protein